MLEKSVPRDHRCHHSANPVMPNGDRRDGFFYPTLTLMIDSYSLTMSGKERFRGNSRALGWSIYLNYHGKKEKNPKKPFVSFCCTILVYYPILMCLGRHVSFTSIGRSMGNGIMTNTLRDTILVIKVFLESSRSITGTSRDLKRISSSFEYANCLSNEMVRYFYIGHF